MWFLKERKALISFVTAPGQIAFKILKPQIYHLTLLKQGWVGKCFNSALVLRTHSRGFTVCANRFGVNAPNMAPSDYQGGGTADAATKSSARLALGSQWHAACSTGANRSSCSMPHGNQWHAARPWPWVHREHQTGLSQFQPELYQRPSFFRKIEAFSFLFL